MRRRRRISSALTRSPWCWPCRTAWIFISCCGASAASAASASRSHPRRLRRRLRRSALRWSCRRRHRRIREIQLVAVGRSSAAALISGTVLVLFLPLCACFFLALCIFVRCHFVTLRAVHTPTLSAGLLRSLRDSVAIPRRSETPEDQHPSCTSQPHPRPEHRTQITSMSDGIEVEQLVESKPRRVSSGVGRV